VPHVSRRLRALAMAAAEWSDALAKDVARCVKKQKVAAAAASDGVDRLLEAVAQARAAAAAGEADALAGLRARLAEVGAATATGDSAKELTAVVGKLGKARRPRARATACVANARRALLLLSTDGGEAFLVRRRARVVGPPLRPDDAAAGATAKPAHVARRLPA
jgi:hypothetical protein